MGNYYQPEIETMPVEKLQALQSERLVEQVKYVYKKPAGLGAPGRGTAFEIEHPDAAKEMESQAAFSAAFHKIWAGAASAVPVSFGYSAVFFVENHKKAVRFREKWKRGCK